MELAPANVPISFEVTYPTDDLSVGMSVYDDSGADPVLVQGPTLMSLVAINTYRAKFTGTENKSYIIIKAVYTDDSLEEVNTYYAQGSESIYTQDASTTGAQIPASVVGYVENIDDVLGLIDCN